MPAGIVNKYHYLAMAGHGMQRFQRLFGKRADAEHDHAAWQSGRSFTRASAAFRNRRCRLDRLLPR